MGEYLIREATLTGIADAIREKAGVESPIFPGEMPGYIRSLSGAGEDGQIPEDIAAEADRVVSAMRSKIGGNSVTFLALADMHQPGDGDIADAAVLERTRRGNRNAGQAAKRIAGKIALDFFVNLGDLAFGSSSTTIRDGTESITSALRYTAGAMEACETAVCLPGNHDPLTSSYSQNSAYLSADVVAGLIGTYRVVDLEEKKVRLIFLNTADNDGAEIAWSESTERISAAQLQWFAESLDLSGKTDGGEWKILIFSHHPLDWGAIRAAGNCLGAYLAGTEFSITHNGTAVSYDFTGKNTAQVIAQFHGHTHCLKVDYIHDNSSGSPVATTVKRIAIPNAYFYRNNEYGTGDNYGLVFGEESTYEKTDDSTGKNTAFCLVSIDMDAGVIYADCFGAGYDRVVSYLQEEIVTYSVTNTLTAAVNSNGAATVTEGEAYAASITAQEGCTLKTVTVTMGGEDVTDTVYADGTISIGAVTGDIVITAVAVVYYDVTNLVSTSEEKNSTAVYNGVGYKNGVYVSDSTDGVDENCVATGYIPYTWAPENVLYIRGAIVREISHVRFYGYTNKTDATPNESAYCNGGNIGVYFSVEQLETEYWKLTPLNTVAAVNYIRISLYGTGEGLYITVNEPIGDSGEEGGATQTNLVLSSLDTDGAVYNGTGYKTDYRLNSSGTETGLAGAVVCGYIPYAGQVLRVSGSAVAEAGTTGNYVALYDESFTKLYSVAFSSLVEYGGVWEESDGVYILTVDPTALTHETYRTYFDTAAYVRCSLGQVNSVTDFTVTLE